MTGTPSICLGLPLWPAALVAGLSFAVVQFLVSNLWGPYATDVLSSLTAIVATVAGLRI